MNILAKTVTVTLPFPVRLVFAGNCMTGHEQNQHYLGSLGLRSLLLQGLTQRNSKTVKEVKNATRVHIGLRVKSKWVKIQLLGELTLNNKLKIVLLSIKPKYVFLTSTNKAHTNGITFHCRTTIVQKRTMANFQGKSTACPWWWPHGMPLINYKYDSLKPSHAGSQWFVGLKTRWPLLISHCEFRS